MALISCSLLSVCCETRETDELGSQGPVELQHTAAYLSSLLNHPFDHAAFKAWRDQKKKKTCTHRRSPGRQQLNLVREMCNGRMEVFREKQFQAFCWCNKVLSNLKGFAGSVTLVEMHQQILLLALCLILKGILKQFLNGVICPFVFL